MTRAGCSAASAFPTRPFPRDTAGCRSWPWNGLPPGEEAICEVWHSPEPLQSGQHGPIRYRQGETLLFGCLTRTNRWGYGMNARPPLQAATEAAYQAIFELLESRGYSAVLRFWNYFPAINQESHHMERYRQFNIGRQDAFLAHGRSVIGNVPAACALGSPPAASTSPSWRRGRRDWHRESPPVQRLPLPQPVWAAQPDLRARRPGQAGGATCCSSPVPPASSVTRPCTGDVVAQTRECLHNIAAIVAEANRQAPEPTSGSTPCLQSLCATSRRPVHGAPEMTQIIGAPVSAIFLQADVCRADLLVEIEASGGPCHRLRFKNRDPVMTRHRRQTALATMLLAGLLATCRRRRKTSLGARRRHNRPVFPGLSRFGPIQPLRPSLPLPCLSRRLPQGGPERHSRYLFRQRPIEFNVSVGASLPVNSDENQARQGMPDLQPTVEVGPALDINLWRTPDRRTRLDLRLPVRTAVTVRGGVDDVGWVFSPRINLDIVDVAGLSGWNLGLLAGPLFGSEHNHDYFYSVAPQYATADRPAFDAEGGYSGSQFLMAVSKRYSKYWLGAFARWDSLKGAAFADSPLVERDYSFSAGIGVAWILGESSTRVEAFE